MKISKKIKQKLINLQKQKYFCPVCQNKVKSFIPLIKKYRGKVVIHSKEYYPYKDCETLNAEAYSCPYCSASDRERLYILFLKKFILKQTQKLKIIHFAPEKALEHFLRKLKSNEYRTADLFMKDVDDIADLTDLHIYSENSFDLLICSHILEHIPSDTQAMQELYRILEPGGKGIIMVPILEKLSQVYEDLNIITDEERLLHFGQEDHIRMYNQKGFIQRLEEVGFKVTLYTINQFSDTDFTINGISKKSVLYIVEK